MRRLNVLDRPSITGRKKHQHVVPLGGGIAIFCSFFLVVGTLFFEGVFSSNEFGRNILGLFFGGLVLMIGGFVDDRFNLKARYQFCYAFLAVFTVIAFGIGPHIISNPFGGIWRLDHIAIPFFGIGRIVVLADLMVFLWLIGMMYTTKFLDGLDGLATGIVAIGAFVLCALNLQERWYNPEIATVSFIFAGALCGFILFNFHPAKIFLGDGGSIFVGFILGSLAVLSGGKIATTFLVLGVPALDVARVILRRLQRRQSVFLGDREHLHYLLIDSGFGHKQTVYLLYGISLLFGMSALFLQSSQQIFAFILLFIIMLFVGVWFSGKQRSSPQDKP